MSRRHRYRQGNKDLTAGPIATALLAAGVGLLEINAARWAPAGEALQDGGASDYLAFHCGACGLELKTPGSKMTGVAARRRKARQAAFRDWLRSLGIPCWQVETPLEALAVVGVEPERALAGLRSLSTGLPAVGAALTLLDMPKALANARAAVLAREQGKAPKQVAERIANEQADLCECGAVRGLHEALNGEGPDGCRGFRKLPHELLAAAKGQVPPPRNAPVWMHKAWAERAAKPARKRAPRRGHKPPRTDYGPCATAGCEGTRWLERYDVCPACFAEGDVTAEPR